MGAFSPTPHLNEEMNKTIMSDIIYPTLYEMNKRNTPFQGILYAGLMLTNEGQNLSNIMLDLVILNAR